MYLMYNDEPATTFNRTVFADLDHYVEHGHTKGQYIIFDLRTQYIHVGLLIYNFLHPSTECLSMLFKTPYFGIQYCEFIHIWGIKFEWSGFYGCDNHGFWNSSCIYLSNWINSTIKHFGNSRRLISGLIDPQIQVNK